MTQLGHVESLWRYPVKSMRGEELPELFVGFSGIRGDRNFAFSSSASRAEFPYFTARDQREMLRYRPRFRENEGRVSDGAIEVETPDGAVFAIENPALRDRLQQGLLDGKQQLTLLRSERALTDTQPVSIISLQTVRQLGAEADTTWDKRRFRANIYIDLTSGGGFAEDQLVGRSIRFGETAIVKVLQRDIRCMMITLDPDTAQKTPALLKTVAQRHEGAAGVYGSVLVEGVVRTGDPIELVS